MKNNYKKIAFKKEESRNIVKVIEKYGVDDDQKIDIIYFLAMTLDNNDALKKICNVVKNFKTSINNEEKISNNINSNKLITDLE